MALKHHIARLERELPTASGLPAAVFVTYPVVEDVENGKRVEKLGEGIGPARHPSRSHILPLTLGRPGLRKTSRSSHQRREFPMGQSVPPRQVIGPILFALDPESIRPLIEQVVTETIERFEKARDCLPEGRLVYSESEAAASLGLNHWQLRDERIRDRIIGSRIVGGRVVYTREDIVRYIMARRTAE
jgi:hypothetical protein